ncbi:V-type ATP synthase subunit I [uncultured Clostridium sp.]|uniref:V-type ATP synthase subunit I n=1 Tax=uncultured Clostridium sp. TaxID=59620 RepID=UPI0026087C23|nr:V-type ATP synthase subunit I [uncultured Clostridium sp.]
MAIVKMNKFTLLTFKSKKDSLLEKLQNFSEVEFIDLQNEDYLELNEELKELSKDTVDEEFSNCEEKLSKAKFALDFLRGYVPAKSGLKAMREGKKSISVEELQKAVETSNWEKVRDKLKDREIKLLELDNEITRLETEIDMLKPWEKFDASFTQVKELKTPAFIGSVSKNYKEVLIKELSNCYLEIIGEDNQDIFFFTLTNSEDKEKIDEILRGFGLSNFKMDIDEVPINKIHTNLDRIEKIKSEKFFIKEELAALEAEANVLELVYEYYHNIQTRKLAKNNFLKTNNTVVIQGWTPVEKNNELDKIATEVLGENYYLTYEGVKEEEIPNVPIKLKNNSVNKSFENITEMYSLPRYNDIDPTPLLAPFFLLFFGMMVADIGYGLVVLIGSIIALKCFKLGETQKQFAKFFFWLSFPTIAFGAIYGAFFGDLIPLPALINTKTDVTTILVMSIVFGVIQIFFGLGIKAYVLIRAGKPFDAFCDVGSWVITLVSIGVFAFGKMTGHEMVGTIGMWCMIIGMVLIVLTQGRHMKSKGGQIGQGLYALYGITGYIGDLVSYTRLMALGLAGGSIAGALNLIIGMFPGIALVIFGPIVFILGHVFNLGLSLLGAYVHTCRLEYVEYFGKFYDGGGRPFKPFKTLDKFINIKKEI